MELIPTIIVALLAIFIAWKFLKGALKTLVLLAILLAVALFVFGGLNA